jgi:transposase
VVAAREAFGQQAQTIHPQRWVFLDESGASTSLTRTRARAAAGQRAIGSVPGGHWQITSLLAAIGLEGVRCCSSVAGAVDGVIFLKWVKEDLAPTLRRGDVVVMDNLGSHKVKGVQEAIAAAGARLLYLPPYSPDLNPIEKCWAKVKQLLRSAAARTASALGCAIEAALAAITPQDLQGFFASCGYG